MKTDRRGFFGAMGGLLASVRGIPASTGKAVAGETLIAVKNGGETCSRPTDRSASTRPRRGSLTGRGQRLKASPI